MISSDVPALHIDTPTCVAPPGKLNVFTAWLLREKVMNPSWIFISISSPARQADPAEWKSQPPPLARPLDDSIAVPIRAIQSNSRGTPQRRPIIISLPGPLEPTLRLIRSYLHERHIQVVAGGESSLEKEIFSGVPQGAKWSPKLWNFDISEMPTVVGPEAIPSNYADDTGLLYVITESNRER